MNIWVMNMKLLIDLFFTFFKIGLFTFGGGYSMISIIENECVEKKKWISKEDMQQIIIIGESTPGPISINISTFVGYKTSKILGSIIATVGIVLPSLITITLVSIFLEQVKDNIFISMVFESIRACVIILMSMAFLNLSKHAKKNILFYALLITSFLLNFIFDIKAIYIILFSLIFSIIYQIYLTKKEKIHHA